MDGTGVQSVVVWQWKGIWHRCAVYGGVAMEGDMAPVCSLWWYGNGRGMRPVCGLWCYSNGRGYGTGVQSMVVWQWKRI
jgi:hypothetical protein